MLLMPKLGNYDVRINPDGLIWLPRPRPEVIIYLNKYYDKVGHNQWRQKIHGPNSCQHLKFIFSGSNCYIVGKGQSLEFLNASHLIDTNAPIICINESIDYIEKLNLPPGMVKFFIQQDMKPECHPDSKTITLLHQDIVERYKEQINRYIFTNNSFGFQKKELTVLVAIVLAKYMGCSSIILFCFDYLTDGNSDYPSEIPDYRISIQAWSNLKERIKNLATPLRVSYFTPLSPEKPSSGIGPQ